MDSTVNLLVHKHSFCATISSLRPSLLNLPFRYTASKHLYKPLFSEPFHFSSLRHDSLHCPAAAFLSGNSYDIDRPLFHVIRQNIPGLYIGNRASTAASGETWPIAAPLVAPENCLSVISETCLSDDDRRRLPLSSSASPGMLPPRGPHTGITS